LTFAKNVVLTIEEDEERIDRSGRRRRRRRDAKRLCHFAAASNASSINLKNKGLKFF